MKADVFVARDRNGGYALLHRLRNLSEEGRCHFILAGFWQLYELVSLDYQSPIKNFGETLTIGALEPEACRELATKPMANLNLGWEDGALVEELIRTTGQRANLIAIACNQVLKRIQLTDQRIDRGSLEAALDSDEIMDAFDGWQNLATEERESRLDRTIVYGMVDHEAFSRREVIDMLSTRGVVAPAEQVERSLRRLDLAYIFQRQRDQYRWSVPLFRENVVRVGAEAYLGSELEDLKKAGWTTADA